ncbi:MAG: zinc ABC transporter substrate-binding protein [Hyphomicrobiaceae bacterium]
MGFGDLRGWLGSIALGLVFAGNLSVFNGSSAAAQSDNLNVVVTIKPIHSLVAQVIDGLGTPTLLIEGQASPHAFALRPSDAKALSGADVVVRVGPSVEPFTVRLAETLPAATTLVTLVEAPGVKLLETRRGSRFEAHEHGDAHDHGHSETKTGEGQDHGDKDELDRDHDAGGMDGHIWLDPDNAIAIAQYIADVLGSRHPQLKERLAANVAKATSHIEALDAELRAGLAPIAGKPFVVFHDAYQYFERHFGLQAAGAITLSPEVKPSARRLSEIRETLAETGAGCVFAEPQFSPRIVASVIEGSQAKAGTLDPIGLDIPAGPGQYAALMRGLAKGLEECLGK